MSFDPASPMVFIKGSATITQVTHFEFSIEQKTTDIKIQQLMDEGFTWICANQLDAAVQAFSDACKLETRNVHLMGKARANLGVALAKLGKTQEAQRCYREVETKEVSADLKALCFSNQALILMEEGRIELAFTYLLMALQCNPQNQALLARIANNHGIIYQRQNKLTDARESFLGGLEFVQGTDDIRTMVRLLNNLAAVSLALEELDAAKRYLDDIAKCLKEEAEIPYQLAQMIAQNRQLLNRRLRSIT